ncbi:hypothetical protein NKG05_05505 [Oerskovia sp. M15]
MGPVPARRLAVGDDEYTAADGTRRPVVAVLDTGVGRILGSTRPSSLAGRSWCGTLSCSESPCPCCRRRSTSTRTRRSVACRSRP